MKVVISSEEDAWAAFERAATGDGFPEGVELVFLNWPVFQMDIKGRDWNSTVPTRVMSPLLEVQKTSIERTRVSSTVISICVN